MDSTYGALRSVLKALIQNLNETHPTCKPYKAEALNNQTFSIRPKPNSIQKTDIYEWDLQRKEISAFLNKHPRVRSFLRVSTTQSEAAPMEDAEFLIENLSLYETG